jgi:LysM repeat protein
MRKLLVIICCGIFHALPAFAQERISISDSAVMTDSLGAENSYSDTLTGIGNTAALITDSIGKNTQTPNSVFDVYWTSNSIKCGWKYGDTLLIGAGLEECDTAYPFIMPVIGRFWRGCSHYHAGWDIGLDTGDPVVAGLGGRVRFAKYGSGYGNLVIVRHYSGLEIYYAHLSKIKVKVNQEVAAGDTIGLGGATGRTRGSHLHMEFRLCDKALDIAEFYKQNDTVVNLYKIKEVFSSQKLAQAADYHTVVRGDTLTYIARQYGTTVDNLTSLNNIGRNSILRIGQKIKVR